MQLCMIQYTLFDTKLHNVCYTPQTVRPQVAIELFMRAYVILYMFLYDLTCKTRTRVLTHLESLILACRIARCR